MSLMLDMLGARRPAHTPALDVDHAVRTLARADCVALFPDATAAAVNILQGAQMALFAASREDLTWLAGYRTLTRAIVYISAERWPAERVNRLTVRSDGRP